MAHNVHVIDHPLVQHKLTLLRKKETSTTSFRRLLSEIGSLMAYEVTRDVSMHEILIETPMETMQPVFSTDSCRSFRARASATSACTAIPRRWWPSSITSRCRVA